MNVELKRIAEKKIEQLGGDVCGVLVRKDGKLAAVDEHGRVQWLQSGQGVEPVAWGFCPECGSDDANEYPDMLRVCNDCGQDWHSDVDYTDAIRTNLSRANAHHQPAQQGSVPHWKELEALTDDYVEGYEFRGDEGDYQPSERERFLIEDCVAGLMDEIHQMLKRATPQPEGQQGSVPEGWRLAPVEPTADMRYAFHEAEQRHLEGSIPSPDGQWWAMLDAAPQPPQEDKGDE